MVYVHVLYHFPPSMTAYNFSPTSDSAYLIIAAGPVVPGPAPMLGHVDVLLVVEFGVG